MTLSSADGGMVQPKRQENLEQTGLYIWIESRGFKRYLGEKKRSMVAEWFWTAYICWKILYMYGDRKIETVYASLTNVTNQEVDDGFTAILTFEGGTEVLVEVGTNNYISLPRWYVLGEDGTAVIRDWQLNGEIIRKTGRTEETVVPVKTAAGLTKTMAPRREDTIVKEDLPKVSGDIADFHRNVVAVIRDGAEPEIKLFQVMRVMKLMEAIFRSAETNQVIEFQDQV